MKKNGFSLKRTAVLLLLVVSLCMLLSGCGETGEDTVPADDTSALTETREDGRSTGETPATARDALIGRWMNEYGEEEPIDRDTINGSPYTVLSAEFDGEGNAVIRVTVDNGEVVYTVYRTFNNSYDYCYMEAYYAAKDITLKYVR